MFSAVLPPSSGYYCRVNRESQHLIGPRRFTAAALALLLLPAAADFARADRLDESAREWIMEQLRCERVPYPVPTVAYFAKRGFIRLKERDGGDSVSCWNLRRPYKLDGLPVAGICAADDTPFMLSLYPDVLRRDAGTSAGTLISIETSLSIEAARTWARSHGIDERNVQKGHFVPERTSIECTSYGLPEYVPR
jgi:hypothetical protein